jgi:hypothetical protein
MLFTLSLDDDDALVAWPVRDLLPLGLAGALLTELALADKVALKNNRLELLDATPCGDVLLDEALRKIASESRPRRVSHWIKEIGNIRTYRQVVERLIALHVIRMEGYCYRWITPYKADPLVNVPAKYWIKQHLRSIVLSGEPATKQDLALLGVLKACRLLRQVFTIDERKAAGKKIAMLEEGEAPGKNLVKLLVNIEAMSDAGAEKG